MILAKWTRVIVGLLLFLLACDPVGDRALTENLTRPAPLVTSIHSETLNGGRKAVKDVLETSPKASLSLAVLDQDHLAWVETFGLANWETQAHPQFDTMYGIGSVSKMFATIAAMILVDRGKIALDTQLVIYVPEFQMLSPEYRDITVRMLLNHSSGLPGTDDRNISTSHPYLNYAQDFLNGLKRAWLNYTPGYLSVYTNDGFTMIENLVRDVSGRSYVNFVQEEIFQPLGMNHSRYPIEVFDSHSFAHGGESSSQEFLNAYGSGGLYSTPSDMVRFTRIFIDQGSVDGTRILSQNSVQEMAVDQTTNQFNPLPSQSLRYGLGWDTVSQPGLGKAGVLGWSKGGDTGVYGSSLLIAPQEKIAVFVVGTSGVTSTKSTAIAETIILQELAARRQIRQMPALLSLELLPERVASVEDLEAMTGHWARSGGPNSLFKTEKTSDGRIVLSYWNGSQWKVKLDDLRFRTDGWFSSVKEPKLSFSTLSADHRDYLAAREVSGYGQYREIARPILLIPAIAGRDQDTLTVFSRNGEEWLRYGPNVLRSLEKIPLLKQGISQKITIGPEGYAEWIKIDASAQGRKLNLTTSNAWKVYRPFNNTAEPISGFVLFKSGSGSSMVEISAGTFAYLMVYGKSAESIWLSG